ncbi:GntR family transcriptional regulator [Devosia ginsengisoli]|uniref:GntR family transcriptional regulator n=1 Tax=Devosia ginsengisoli TaxID=400770 RepID=A0A5B8LXQ6_9HYPH|nr:GntR family transcriptional regulator [Devosia ginsengisoli]QDZ12591.1 GntR family transcriptional regulator [Devosia ginsengisoli]
MDTTTLTLRDHTYRSLLALILSGELPPGSPLDERALTDRLGVSRTPFREAIAVLAREGLVDVRPYRGFSVHLPSPKEIDDLYQLRRVLEGFAMRLAVENISNADIARLEQVLDAGIAALEANDLDAYGVHDTEFHATFARLSKNEPLIETLERLALRIQMGRATANRNVHFAKAAASERDAILGALRARDADRAAALMDAHIAHVQRAVSEQMAPSAGNDGHRPARPGKGGTR